MDSSLESGVNIFYLVTDGFKSGNVVNIFYLVTDGFKSGRGC